MTKRMLIDASHAEETRVVVLDGNRLEDFDVETSTKRQLKGNIYLAKVVRVEPSLQAAFVEYGGGRHGFLAFDEIHPDYYQIPVADRQRLLAMQAEDAEREAAEDDRAAEAASAGTQFSAAPQPDQPFPVEHPETAHEPYEDEPAHAAPVSASEEPVADTPELQADTPELQADMGGDAPVASEPTAETAADNEPVVTLAAMPAAIQVEIVYDTIDPDIGAPTIPTETEAPADAPTPEQAVSEQAPAGQPGDGQFGDEQPDIRPPVDDVAEPAGETADEDTFFEAAADVPPPETVGGETDTGEEVRERRMPRFMRSYKIQEVIKRRQILLVQVVKEERGTKGAALTTYISLAGRFCVLMPNSPRGGGISRKITSAADRRRLKEITAELDIPRGMGLIVRTAGANRPKPEIRRDCEYLLRLWDDIRDHTMRSVAPALIYEEASLIKRAIRDVYSRDVDEILVDGEDGWKAARDFMRMLMPAHVKKVVAWRGDGQPLFAKHQVDAQLDAMLQPTVQLKSGGYLVINQTEALVAIDVNSGRSTRERGIEETALRTNTEAASEVARQLRLRDLAGLVVIDFIDMESKKNNAIVERRIKEALKDDRARIQVGHISHFGLLEMSRQRLRPSLAESSFVMCTHCAGTGQVRSTESAAIHVLRHIEEEGAKRRAAEIVVHVATPTAMYILNAKRDRLGEIENRYGMRVTLSGDDTLIAPQVRIDRVRAQPAEASSAITSDSPPASMTSIGSPVGSTVAISYASPETDEAAASDADDDVVLETDDDSETSPAGISVAGISAAGSPAEETAEEGERRRRRRRRRRGGHREDGPSAGGQTAPAATQQPIQADAGELSAGEPTMGTENGSADGGPGGDMPAASDAGEDGGQRPRRRGRRGGRRRRREGEEEVPAMAEPGVDQQEIPASAPYRGPTPADPFGGSSFDIFDVMDEAERAAEPAPQVVLVDTVLDIPPPPPPAPEPEPETVSPANDVAAAPLVQPVMIGETESPPAEKRRGWWRR